MPTNRTSVEQAAAAFRVLDAVRRVRFEREMAERRMAVARRDAAYPDEEERARLMVGPMPVRIGGVDFPAVGWLGPHILMAAEREARAALLSLGVKVSEDA